MKRNLFNSALLAAGGALLLASAAHAQTINYANGDLILGVEATGGVGASFDYEVDLGNINLFTAGNNIDFSNLVLNSDLSSSSANGGFGSGYQTRSDVSFSVVGDTNGTDITNPQYGTLFKKELTISSLTPLAAQSAGQLSGPVGQVSTVNTTLETFAPTTTGGAAAFVPTSNSGSYTAEETLNMGTAFGESNPNQLTMATAATGATLDLYLLNPVGDSVPQKTTVGTSTLLGDFSFENGDLIFNSATATPEPSTYALFMLGAGLLVWAARRRTINS